MKGKILVIVILACVLVFATVSGLRAAPLNEANLSVDTSSQTIYPNIYNKENETITSSTEVQSQVIQEKGLDSGLADRNLLTASHDNGDCGCGSSEGDYNPDNYPPDNYPDDYYYKDSLLLDEPYEPDEPDEYYENTKTDHLFETSVNEWISEEGVYFDDDAFSNPNKFIAKTYDLDASANEDDDIDNHGVYSDSGCLCSAAEVNTAEEIAAPYEEVGVEEGAIHQPISTLAMTVLPPDAHTCTQEEIDAQYEEVTEDPGGAQVEVHIRCDLTLSPNDVVKKRLVLEGAASSGVTVNCNGAILDGSPGTPYFNQDLIQVRSRQYEGNGDLPGWDPPSDITIKNCNVLGSVRIFGMGHNGESEHVRNSSRYDAHHSLRARRAAPRRITLERMTIIAQGRRTPLYLAPGVSYMTLAESEITGRSESVGVYLDAESYRNTLCDNYFHVTSRKKYCWLGFCYTRKREEMALDGSSENRIINNRFSTLEGGGIYLYRNCGEGGTIRHSTPSRNTIINNTFYYRRYTGPKPAIYVGSRGDNWWRTYCDDDEGKPWGSSADNRSFARHNIIMQNQFFRRQIYSGSYFRTARLDDYIKQGDSSNHPNFIEHNEIVTDETVQTRLAGCYVSNGYLTNFIEHGESISLYLGIHGEPSCGDNLICNNSQLELGTPNWSNCNVTRVPFECQVTGDNGGCRRYAFCGWGETILAAKAACNLEWGTVPTSALESVPVDSIEVLRASDIVYSGLCWVGNTSAVIGQRGIDDIGGRYIEIGCKEYDKNGGDCHIRGELYCYSNTSMKASISTGAVSTKADYTTKAYYTTTPPISSWASMAK